MNGKNRSDVKPGINVKIVKKEDQKTGKLTQGIVKELLTNSSTHPHGIKVKLVDGAVGRVQEIIG
ncbi:MAG: YwbE family protein [Fusobacteriaceae bacterium]